MIPAIVFNGINVASNDIGVGTEGYSSLLFLEWLTFFCRVSTIFFTEKYDQKLSVKGGFDDVIKASVFANRKPIKKAAVKKAAKKSS